MQISELPGCVLYSSYQFYSLYYAIIDVLSFVVSFKFPFYFSSLHFFHFYCFDRLVCEDISNGQENFRIPATNLVDNPPIPPSGMLHTLKETS